MDILYNTFKDESEWGHSVHHSVLYRIYRAVSGCYHFIITIIIILYYVSGSSALISQVPRGARIVVVTVPALMVLNGFNSR